MTKEEKEGEKFEFPEEFDPAVLLPPPLEYEADAEARDVAEAAVSAARSMLDKTLAAERSAQVELQQAERELATQERLTSLVERSEEEVEDIAAKARLVELRGRRLLKRKLSR